MPVKDIYHDHVKRALIKDGWTITDDPYILKYGVKILYADLGAERLLAAEKEFRKIIVEVKSFIGQSDIHDLQEALGKYIMYFQILQEQQSDRHLYLAVRDKTYYGILSTDIGQLMIARASMRLIVVDTDEEVILQWIPG